MSGDGSLLVLTGTTTVGDAYALNGVATVQSGKHHPGPTRATTAERGDTQ